MLEIGMEVFRITENLSSHLCTRTPGGYWCTTSIVESALSNRPRELIYPFENIALYYVTCHSLIFWVDILMDINDNIRYLRISIKLNSEKENSTTFSQGTKRLNKTEGLWYCISRHANSWNKGLLLNNKAIHSIFAILIRPSVRLSRNSSSMCIMATKCKLLTIFSIPEAIKSVWGISCINLLQHNDHYVLNRVHIYWLL